VYADHGHQSDLLNKFGGWPNPFTKRDGVLYLRKPWGENMVQQFYNQYEQVFPIIDNLSEETAGMQYAISQAGFGASARAVGQFFRFLLFEESMRQALALLGGTGDPVIWDNSWVRMQPTSFFVDFLSTAPGLQRDVVAAKLANTLEFSAASMTEEEINVFCLAKETRKDGNSCKRTVESGLSRLVQGAVLTDIQVRRNYLRAILPQVAPKPSKLASVYVYGHTHKAVESERFPLGDLGFGSASIVIANTGAFQRIASPAQIDAIMASLYKGAAKSPLDLQPEQLPHCYNFVWIPPYQEKPNPIVWRWAEDIDSKGEDFREEVGTCVSRQLRLRTQ
jgi:hypothetical protein